MTKLFDKLYLNVGAMKAGTTWLYRQLEQHPAIVFSHEKELHYLAYRDGNPQALSHHYKAGRRDNAFKRFAGDTSSPEYAQLLDWYDNYMSQDMDDVWYRARFPKDLAPGQYCADFSNLTCLVSPKTWKAVLEMSNEVKASYVLRNPYDRIWSHFKFHFQLQNVEINPDTVTEADLRAFNQAHETVKHSAYSRHIIRMRNILGEAAVKLICYDDIETQPAKLLAEIEDFLGLGHLNYQQGKVNRKINTSESLPVPDCLYSTFAIAVNNELSALADLGFAVPAAWREPSTK